MLAIISGRSDSNNVDLDGTETQPGTGHILRENKLFHK